MKLVLPVSLVAICLVAGCVGARPAEAAPLTARMKDAGVCSAIVAKLKSYEDPNSSEPSGLGIAASVADMKVTLAGGSDAEKAAALQAGKTSIENMIAGKTPEESKTLLEDKLPDCMSLAGRTDGSGESRNG